LLIAEGHTLILSRQTLPNSRRAQTDTQQADIA
jgi:hypothetical protein